MQLLGPLYVISNPPHQILIDPADLESLRVAVRHAVDATALDPAKVDTCAVRYGPFSFAFQSVARQDVRPHWAGTLRYGEQELPLFAWAGAGAGTLHDLLEALFGAGEGAPCAAHEAEVVWHHDQ